MKAIDERRLSKVTSIETPYGPAVEKTFVSAESCLREADVYRRMEGSGLRCAKLLEQKEKSLILSRLFGEDYVSLLARQEREGLDLHPWHSLLAWTISFYEITGLIQNDMNLRNFLFCDSEAVGIDFEDCREGDAGGMLAELSAFVLLLTSGEREPCRHGGGGSFSQGRAFQTAGGRLLGTGNPNSGAGAAHMSS